MLFRSCKGAKSKGTKKKKTQKIDVGSAGDDRWPRWAFKLSAVQYVHLEMYQMITTSLLPRTYSEKAIFNRLVYTVSQNCIKRQSIWAISRKKKKKKKQCTSPRIQHVISTRNSQHLDSTKTKWRFLACIVHVGFLLLAALKAKGVSDWGQ